jgi:D-alanyl-D-alanine dipeptidase
MKKMQKNITIILVAVSILVSCANEPNRLPGSNNNQTIRIDTVASKTKKDSLIGNWTKVQLSTNGILELMAYADTNNFMHQKVYPCAQCYLRPEAAEALYQAQQFAISEHLKLVIFDCYRPKMLQQKMYDLVQNPKYVALPTKGSMHNKGLAVDIALANENNVLLDFGSSFDDFSEKAHYQSILVSAEAKLNQKKLRSIMQKAGFEPYENEWWHFNYTQKSYPVDSFIWNCND